VKCYICVYVYKADDAGIHGPSNIYGNMRAAALGALEPFSLHHFPTAVDKCREMVGGWSQRRGGGERNIGYGMCDMEYGKSAGIIGGTKFISANPQMDR